ncbi:MAG: rhodanese-like domain-containing protein [Dehalococcoidaceae bacterium]|nr:rhodanese-like domain-containing protein [Dehalococcoidaceae bacterium]
MVNKLNKIVIAAIVTIAFLLTAGCGGAAPASTGTLDPSDFPDPPSPEQLAASNFLYPDLPRITAMRLKYMIDTGEPVVVVDTRLSMFFNGGHIPESVNIPVTTGSDLADPAGFYDLPKDKFIVFYCD